MERDHVKDDEVQIQRLLQRSDADERRIVCPSAILPSGREFDDFVSWLPRDVEDEAVVSDWRPTRRPSPNDAERLRNVRSRPSI
jgi:hypothetical protein